RKPHAILDGDGRIVTVLVGRPQKDSSGWDALIRGVAELMEAFRRTGDEESLFSGDQRQHRRGNFVALSRGISYGGGQREPKNLAHGARLHQLLQDFVNENSVKRIAGFQNCAFAAFAPKLYLHYVSKLRQLYDDPRLNLVRNWPNSILPCATFNFGPKTSTFLHTDPGNAAYGWCIVTALGNFNHQVGGCLILPDLDVVCQIPSGSTYITMSAILQHGNTSIQEDEARMSMTQYCAGGLLRWVANGGKVAKGSKVVYNHGERVCEALSLLSKPSELSKDREALFQARNNP
ncbi:hypothetical protein BDN72DRAFT_766345, partial [Pluteus cervinus]